MKSLSSSIIVLSGAVIVASGVLTIHNGKAAMVTGFVLGLFGLFAWAMAYQQSDPDKP